MAPALENFRRLNPLIEETRSRGYEISLLCHVDMIAMLAEAGQKSEPSISERLGWFFESGFVGRGVVIIDNDPTCCY